MKTIDLESKSIEELWALHEQIAAILAAKMQAEKLKLEKRLQDIEPKTRNEVRGRRYYPKVYPKYRNPNPPHQTWSGRGEKPRWVRELLAKGKQLSDFPI